MGGTDWTIGVRKRKGGLCKGAVQLLEYLQTQRYQHGIKASLKELHGKLLLHLYYFLYK